MIWRFVWSLVDQDLPDVSIDLHDGVAVVDDELVFVLPWFVGQDFLVDANGFIFLIFEVGRDPVGRSSKILS